MGLRHTTRRIESRCDDGENFPVEIVERLQRQEFFLQAYQRFEHHVGCSLFIGPVTFRIAFDRSHDCTSKVGSIAVADEGTESRADAMRSISSQETTWQPALTVPSGSMRSRAYGPR